MTECHVEAPCPACIRIREAREQSTYEASMKWYREASRRMLAEMRFEQAIDQRIEEARAATPWLLRKLRRF